MVLLPKQVHLQKDVGEAARERNRKVRKVRKTKRQKGGLRITANVWCSLFRRLVPRQMCKRQTHGDGFQLGAHLRPQALVGRGEYAKHFPFPSTSRPSQSINTTLMSSGNTSAYSNPATVQLETILTQLHPFF